MIARPLPLLALAVLALLAALASPGLSPDAQAQALTDNKIVYGFSREFAPFSYERDGEPVGFEIDLLRAVLADQDVELVIKPMNWIQVQMDLSDGLIDVTSGMAKTEQRQLLYSFSDLPTAAVKARLFTQSDHRVANVTQLRGNRVSVKEGSLYQRILEEVGGMNIKLYPTEAAALKALYEGDVDAFGGADKTAFYLIDLLGLDHLSPVGTPLEITNMYFAVNKERQDLLAMINQGMRRVMENGEYEALYRQWFVRELDDDEMFALMDAAKAATVNAYAPYSQEPTGAAVLGMSGQLYTGCNVENGVPRFSASAITVAVLNAVSGGETDIRAAVAVLPDGRLVTPTAEERRLLQEFGRGILVITEPEPGRYMTHTIAELLPTPYQTNDTP